MRRRRRVRSHPKRRMTEEETERWWRMTALKALGASHPAAWRASVDFEAYQRCKRRLLFP